MARLGTYRRLHDLQFIEHEPPREDVAPSRNAFSKEENSMPVRSMTGFAQVKGQVNDQTAFTLSLKSVNHRFLDLHFRMPSESDGLEMKLRRLLKEKLARGHIEITLSIDRADGDGFKLNRELVSGYIQAFRAASTEFGLMADPDLNVVLRLPGAMGGSNNLNKVNSNPPSWRRSNRPCESERNARRRRTRN